MDTINQNLASNGTEIGTEHIRRNNEDTAVNLSSNELDRVLTPLSGRARQIRRVGLKPNRHTAECNLFSTAINPSDLRQKYSKSLRCAGYELICKIPPKPILCGYGEWSSQFLSALYPVNTEVLP